MSHDAERENEQKRFLKQLRLLERGKDDPDRGKDDPDRGKDDPDRGKDDPDRGLVTNGHGPRQLADIFQRAAGIGGHLVVAFVAPIAASPRRPNGRYDARASDVAVAAQAEVDALRDQLASNLTLARQRAMLSVRMSLKDPFAPASTQASSSSAKQQSETSDHKDAITPARKND
jgi:hypothetical protein